VQLCGKEYVSNLEGLGFKPMLPYFFNQLSTPDGGGGGEPTWWRATGRSGGDHHADWTEFIIYCVYEYKYTKY
jgi:hypothetical protein